MRSGWLRGSIYRALLFWDWFVVTIPLSRVQRRTLWLLQGLSQRPSIGGFGLRDLFHVLTCAGCASNLLAISAVLSSSFNASSATLALNPGLCFLRLSFIVCSFLVPCFLGAVNDLSYLSNSLGPPQCAVFAIEFVASWLRYGSNKVRVIPMKLRILFELPYGALRPSVKLITQCLKQRSASVSVAR